MTSTKSSLGIQLAIAFSLVASLPAWGNSTLYFGEVAESSPAPIEESPPLTTETTNDPEAIELSCLLQKVRWCAKEAKIAGEAYAKAFRKIQLSPRLFNRVSLMHMLAQITSESTYGENLIEIDQKVADVRGYGYNQVTGPGNLRAAEKCINEVDPGAGDGVSSRPKETIGKIPYIAAIGSLCWWKMNMVEIPKHQVYIVTPTESAVKTITQIANSGRIGGQIIKENTSLPPRQARFTKLMELDRAGVCRGITELEPQRKDCGYK